MPFQRFILISAFFSHFSVLSPFQRFIPISAFYWFYPPSQFPFSVSVSAIQFQRFIPAHLPQARRSFKFAPFLFFFLLFLFCLIWREQQIRFLNSTKLFRTCHFSVLSPFQRFIPISVSVFSFRFRHSVSAFYPDPFLYLCLPDY